MDSTEDNDLILSLQAIQEQIAAVLNTRHRPTHRISILVPRAEMSDAVIARKVADELI